MERSIPACPLLSSHTEGEIYEQRAYYSVENLTTLKAENNSLFTQMVAVTEQVYRLCQPEKTTVITTVTFMDVVEYLDLLDDLSKLLYNITSF